MADNDVAVKILEALGINCQRVAGLEIRLRYGEPAMMTIERYPDSLEMEALVPVFETFELAIKADKQ